MEKITLGVEGMTCSACSNGLEKHLKKQPGVLAASVNLVMANAYVEYDESVLDQKKIEKFIKDAGFKSTGLFDLSGEGGRERGKKALLIVYSVLAVLLLYVSMGHMIGIPVPAFLNMHENPVSYTCILLGLTIPFLVYGADLLRNGVKNLVHLAPNMDTLVTLGVLASLGYSVYSMVMIFTGHPAYVDSLYLESCAIIVYFIKLGRLIDSANKNKTKQAIKDLVRITPGYAYRKEGEEIARITIDEVREGDLLVCRAGDKFAVDGEVVSGNSHVDESFITGESRPAAKQPGKKVVAGSINLDGYIEYRAEKIGRESTVSEIVKMVVEATNTKMPIAKLADVVSGIFVPVVMGIAAVVFVLYLCLGQGINAALETFVTVLVVACPCALGLATPLAVVISEGLCARRGILVKKSETLEIANKIDTVVFDKTGTLTYGNLKIAAAVNYSGMSDDELLALAGSMEAQSSHPIGRAFAERMKEKGLSPLPVTDFCNVAGKGITGRIDGDELILGNAKILEAYSVDNPHADDEAALAQAGNSIVYVVKNREIAGLFGVNDIVKADAADVIKDLKSRGIEVIMLTGDNEKTAELIAAELGIGRVIADVLPRQKAELVKQLKAEGRRVLMCGDGINDSPALANADIGLSVPSGTDIAMNTADVILMNEDLGKIGELLAIGKKTIRNIKQNLFWAFFYNCLMLPIAAGAFRPLGISISPMIAGLAMVLSSITVILNALRLKLIHFQKGDKKDVRQQNH